MFGTEAQTELDDLKVVATRSGGRMKYIDWVLCWPKAAVRGCPLWLARAVREFSTEEPMVADSYSANATFTTTRHVTSPTASNRAAASFLSDFRKRGVKKST